MLRTLVGLLVLLNIGYWAWSQGLLAHLGVWAYPQERHEPQRLARQVQPERIRLLAADAPEIVAPVVLGETAVVLSNTDEAPSATPPDPSGEPKEMPNGTPSAAPNQTCSQTAYFSEKDLPRIEPLLKAALPEGSWTFAPVPQPARWIVYTGKLSGPEAVAETKAVLRERKIGYREVSPALQPGLALGTFSSEEAALQGVRDVTRNGYKGAKAVMERAEYSIYTLRLPHATDELKAKAGVVLSKQGEAKAAKSWQSCDD